MKTFILMILSTVFASATPTVWTIKKFEESCTSKGGQIVKKEYTESLHRECQVGGKEINSAWFHKKNKKAMIGWLDRKRNQNQQIILDQEYDEQGSLKQKTFYVRTIEKPNEKIESMFAFDRKGNLLRGNIALESKEDGAKEDRFVIADPLLIFHNDKPSNLKTLTQKLRRYGVSDDVSFEKQIETIWNHQNFSTVLSPPPREKTKGAQ